MLLRSLASVAAALALATLSEAQTLDDALRYSENFPLGTARSLGVSNSMSALGADYSAVSSNPAGLAAFRRNDFSLTFGSLTTGSNASSLDGGPTAQNDGNTKFAVPQAGLVLTRRPIASKWTQLNFGLGVSQSNRFEESLNFRGTSAGSITDVWLDEANRYGLGADGRRDFVNGDFVFNPLALGELSDYSSGLAFDAGVLIPGDDTENPPFYNSDYDLARGAGPDLVNTPGAPLDKSGTVTRSGRNATIDFSIAGNYDEKLMIGATVGLSRLKYNGATNYREDDAADAVASFERLSYNQISEISGTGVQLRVGAIYRPMQALRIGLAYHSPSRISLTDSYTTNLQYIYIDRQGGTVNGNGRPDQPSVIEYRFTTPSQYKASAAVLLGQRGFLSTELTYINFAGGSFKSDFADSDASVNNTIDQSLKGAVQARFGGELNVKPFQVRAGFQYIGAPIDNEDAVLGATAGVGFRQNRLGLDLGYQLLLRPDRTFVPYNIEPLNFPQSSVAYTPTSHTLALTLGWKLVSLD